MVPTNAVKMTKNVTPNCPFGVVRVNMRAVIHEEIRIKAVVRVAVRVMPLGGDSIFTKPNSSNG